METLENPKVDVKVIQQRANEAAEKAYLKEIEAYYTSYNSPYRKLIAEELEKQEFTYSMRLPNIMEKINKALSDQIDQIANNAIAHSFIPMVHEALVKIDKDLKISKFLQMVIEELHPDSEEAEEFNFSYSKNRRNNWLDCQLITHQGSYEFTLHGDMYGTPEGKHKLLSMPSDHESRFKKVKIIKDDVTVEIPFTSNILQDKVMNIFFKILLSECVIDVDCDEFDEDWFPRNECHC